MITAFILGALMIYVLFNSLKKPGVILVLIFSMFAIEQLLQINYTIFLKYNYLFNVIVGTIALIFMVKLLLKHGLLNQKFILEEILVYILFLYAFMSIAWSPDYSGSIERWSTKLPYIILFLILVPRLVTSVSNVTDMIPMQVIVGGIISLLLITTGEWNNRLLKIGDTYGVPLATATMACYTILCTALYRENNNNQIGKYIFKAVIIGICLTLIIISGSRGQLFAVFIAMIVCWPLSYKIKNIGGFIFFVVFSMLLIFFTAAILEQIWSDNVRYDFDKMSRDMAGRFDMAFVMLSEAISNPFSILFGLGNGASFAIVGFYPHMVPLEILSEEGLFGFMIYLLIIFYALKNIIKLNGLLENNYNKYRRAGAILAAYFVVSFLLTLKQGDLIGSLNFFITTIILAKYTRMIETSVIHAQRVRQVRHGNGNI